MTKISKQQVSQLLGWYKKNQRDFPWRKTKDPYKIWISEIMLQQTTSTAVIPFYERFLKRFPHIKALASAPLDDVNEQWAGLGYYSRAKNIHETSKIIAQSSFPQTHVELIKLPGLGPYTARAISSFAFDEHVAVVDGNVIRFLSRFLNTPFEWWKTKDRNRLQTFADQWMNWAKTSEINQALIEIGATLCTKQNPYCTICPVKESCLGLKAGTIDKLPIKPNKRKSEIWIWQPEIYKQNNKIAFISNNYSPFLKGKWILPGQAKLVLKKPSQFDFVHFITHHEIFVQPKWIKKPSPALSSKLIWLKVEDVPKKIPFSLIRKTLDRGLADKK